MRLSKRFAIIVLLLLHAGFAHAATIHVELWGLSSLPCGGKTTPCNSISLAIAQADDSRNPKIVVGPGFYEENVDITAEGTRLESLAGARATIVEADLSSDHVIDISAVKVKIGKRGKGFTLRGASSINFAGIHSVGDLTKIEGNVVAATNSGIYLTGERNQVRFNELLGNSLYSIRCENCDKSLIADNRITGSLYGIDFLNTEDATIQRNVYRGTSTLAYAVRLRSGVSNINLKDNAAELAGWGYYVENAEGLKMTSNIASRNARYGMQIMQQTIGKGPLLKNNLVTSGRNAPSFGVGVYLEDVQDLKFEGNSVIDNLGTGMEVANDGLISSFAAVKSNNFYGNGFDAANDDCAIDNNTGNDIAISKTFLGSMPGSTPDADDVANDDDRHDTICETSGAIVSQTNGSPYVSKPAKYSVSKAAKL